MRQGSECSGADVASRAFECVHGALGFVVLPGGQGRACGLYGMCLRRHKLAQQALVGGAFVQHAPQAGGHIQPWDVAQCVIGRRRGGRVGWSLRVSGVIRWLPLKFGVEAVCRSRAGGPWCNPLQQIAWKPPPVLVTVSRIDAQNVNRFVTIGSADGPPGRRARDGSGRVAGQLRQAAAGALAAAMVSQAFRASAVYMSAGPPPM